MNEGRIGKPSPRELEKLLGKRFGAPSDAVLIGPGAGLDAAVLDLGDGRVMAIAEDPIFPAPGLPLEIMGYFTVHIGASDVAVTGIAPRFMTYTLLMPPASPSSEADVIIRSISETAESLGISIVGGHTGWYGAVTVPTVGGVTVWGIADKDSWVSPGGARDGDVILMSKGPAIEAAALLGVLYRDRISDRVDSRTLDKVCARTAEITVVKDALSAFSTGAVHAMHDATEGGVLGGLWEMHASSGVHLAADLDGAPVPEDIAAIAEALDFDPWLAISEGTLLTAVDPGRVDAVRQIWNDQGILSFVLGRFDASLSRNELTQNGRSGPLPDPQEDPFWRLFFAGLSEKG